MNPEPPIDFRRKRDFGEVLNVTFRFIRQNLAPLSKSLLFFVAPFLVVAMLFNVAVQVQVFSGGFLSGEGGTPPDFSGLLLNYAGITFFSLIAGTMAWAVILGFMRLYDAHGPGGHPVQAVWEEARGLSFRMLGTVAFFLMIVSVFYIFFAFFISIGVAVFAQAGAVVAGLFTFAAVVGFVAGLVYVVTILALLFPMRAFERIGLIEGAGRSLRLVRGYWWQTFGVIFLAWFLSSVLGGIFSMPSVVLSFLQGMNTLEGGGTALRVLLVVFGVLGGLASSLLYSIPMLATAFQYFNLVERKEGVGLMARIERLAEDDDERAGPNGVAEAKPEGGGAP
ncbi:hypothetical protein [Rhodocaloribacter sp.]